MCRKPLPPGFDILADPLLLGRNIGHRQRASHAYFVANGLPGTVNEAVVYNCRSEGGGDIRLARSSRCRIPEAFAKKGVLHGPHYGIVAALFQELPKLTVVIE